MYLFIVITVSLVIGGALGYFLATLHRKSEYNNFFDPEEASSFGEAGRKAVQERIARKKDRIMEKAKAEGRITNDGVEELFCIKR